MTNLEIAVEVLGWIGSLEILMAYGLNTYQKLRSDSFGYILLNLTGGILLILYTIYKAAFASTFINVVWVIIAGVALAKLFIKPSTKP